MVISTFFYLASDLFGSISIENSRMTLQWKVGLDDLIKASTLYSEHKKENSNYYLM